MKPKSANRFLLSALACISLASHSAFAAAYYWDNDGTTAGFGTAAGIWAAPTTGDATQGWSTSATGVLLPGNITTLGTSATVDSVNFGNGATGLAAGTITVSGTVASGNMTFASGSGSVVLSGGTINLTNGATGPSITVNSTSAPATIGSDLTGGLASSTVTKAGAGTLYLSGNNSYLSRTSITGGVLVLDSANALPGTGMFFGNGSVLGLKNSNFTRIPGTNSPAAGTFYFSSNGGFAAYAEGRSVNMGGAGGFVGFGSGNVTTVVGTLNGKTLVLGAADATHKLIFINGLDMGSTTRSVQVNNGPAAVDAEISGVITGAANAGLNKSGTGTVLLSNTNTITGPLSITAGTVMVGNPAALGASSAITTVTNGAVLDLNGTAMTIANPLTLNGTGISSSGSLINSSATPGTFAGPVTFGNTSLRIGGTGTITLSNTSPIVGTDSSLTLAGAGGSVGGALQTGAGTLTTNSTGTWSLTGTSTYTGATAVDGGGLALAGTGSINDSSGITINAPGAKLLQASSVPVSPTVTLTQGTVTGSGTVNTVNVGAGTGGIISNNNGAAGAALTIGTLTFDGAATVNTFSNSTAAPITTTTLATNAAGTVTINASAPVWADNSTHALISYGGGSVGGAGSAQFVLGTVAGLSARQVASPALGDSGTAITLAITGDTPYWKGDGDDTWNLSSANNWSLLSDNSSALYLANDNVLFNDNATGTGPISVNIDAANVAPNSTTFNNTKDYVLGSTGGFGISSGSLLKNGSGKLTINNANTYPSGTIVNAGTLQLGNANAIGSGLLTLNGGNLDSSVANLVNAGNNAQLWNSDFTFVGTESLNLGTGSVTLSGNRTVTVSANNLTVGGSIGGGAVDLTKLGTGTLTLTGGSTFTGTLAVNAGTLALSPTTAGAFTMSNALSGAGTISVNPFAANSSNLTLGGDLSGFTGVVNVATSGGFNSKLATTGAFSSFGAGTVVNVANGGTWYSTVNQTGITVNLFGTGNSENLGALRLDNATLDSTSSVVLKANGSIGGAGSSTITAPISEDGGSFGFTKQGSGTIFLSGTNSYSGLTTVSAGVLVLQNSSALGTTAGGTTVADGLRVELDNLTVTGEAITITGAGGDNLGALRSRSGTSVWAGPVTVNAELTRIGAIAGSTFEVSGVIDDGVNDYRVRFRPNSATATVIISGANTYTGGTSIFGGNVVTSSFNSVVGGTASSNFGAPVTAANGMIIIGIGGTVNDATLSYIGAGETTDRTFQIGDNSTTPVVGDNGAGAIQNNGVSGALVFSAPIFNSPSNALTGTSPTRTLTLGGTNTSANTISGVIQNNQIAGNPTAAVAVTKTGIGSWTLAGPNTYTGATTVSAGTLAVGASNVMPDTSAVSVGSATLAIGSSFSDTLGTLDATGSATLNIGSGATIAFANSSAIDWTGGSLDITGTFVTGSSVRFGASSSALTPTQLALITINGASGSYALDTNGYLVNLTGYAAWKAINAPTGTSDGDYDGDGVSNGAEYVLGGDKNTNDANKQPAVSTSGGDMLFTFVRDQDSIDGSTVVQIETGSTLASWPNVYAVPDAAAANNPGVTVAKDTSPGFDTVTLTIQRGVIPAQFARLKVITP